MTHVNKMLYNNFTGYGHVVQLVGVSSVGDVANMLATCCQHVGNMLAKWSLALKSQSSSPPHKLIIVGPLTVLISAVVSQSYCNCVDG